MPFPLKVVFVASNVPLSIAIPAPLAAIVELSARTVSN
jgi:hypothetical protein